MKLKVNFLYKIMIAEYHEIVEVTSFNDLTHDFVATTILDYTGDGMEGSEWDRCSEDKLDMDDEKLIDRFTELGHKDDLPEYFL